MCDNNKLKELETKIDAIGRDINILIEHDELRAKAMIGIATMLAEMRRKTEGQDAIPVDA